MKKIFYSLFAVASLLLATSSCSSEEELIPSGKNEGVEVSFQLALDDAASSRALTNDPADDTYGRGKRVNNVIAAVYSNGTEIEALRKPTNSINQETLTCNVTFRLIEGQTYDFVFWAEKTGTGFYNTTDLNAIKVNYAGNANDEDRDAFTAVRKGLRIKNGGMSENIVLTRPFAQLNIASTDEDHRIAEAAGFGCGLLTSKINIKNVYDTFDAYNETPSGSAEINFNLAAVPGDPDIHEVLKNVKGKNDAEGQDYRGYLSMNYFLAEAGSSQNVDVVARFESSSTGAVPVEISVPHVPVRRNYRTNIIGNILTEQAVFNIIIDPNFKTPDYIVGWDGKTVVEATVNANGEYEVSSPSQLAWIAQQVNGGIESFEGKTVKLTSDINLGGQEWTPIGTGSSVSFNGHFDGNGKTISNYVINDEDGAGLFGYVGFGSIKNLTVSDVTIVGHHYAGALVAWVQNPGTSDPKRKITVIDNCHAKYVNVTLTPDANNDNGDKAGGLIGYAVRTSITNCSVSHAEVTAYRDCGGLLGHANANATVTNNKVTNSVVTADQTPDYKDNSAANAGKVAGRIADTAVVESNEAGDDVEVVVIMGAQQSLKELVDNSNIDTIVLSEDVNVGTTQLAITRPVTIDLNNMKLSTANAYGGISLKNGASVKNGTINHTGNTAAIKAWNVESIENVIINVTPTAGKTKGGIVIQSGADSHISLIKNVTITGTTNGIETYNCGWTDETPAIGVMENVTIDATDTGILLSAHIGKAKNCNIKGVKYGINMHLKGEFKVGVELEGCTVTGTEASIWGHDEPGVSNTNNCSLSLKYDAATTLNGPFIWDFEDECKGVVTLNRP